MLFNLATVVVTSLIVVFIMYCAYLLWSERNSNGGWGG